MIRTNTGEQGSATDTPALPVRVMMHAATTRMIVFGKVHVTAKELLVREWRVPSVLAANGGMYQVRPHPYHPTAGVIPQLPFPSP